MISSSLYDIFLKPSIGFDVVNNSAFVKDDNHFKRNSPLFNFINFFNNNFQNLINEILKFLDLNLNFNFEELKDNTFQVPKDGVGKTIFYNKTMRKLGDKIFSSKTRAKLAKKIIYEKNGSLNLICQTTFWNRYLSDQNELLQFILSLLI